MKKNILSLLILLMAATLQSQNFQHITYVSSDSVIANPERGFFRFTSASSQGQYESLDTASLRAWREAGYTLIFRYFYLEDYMASDIEGSYLSGMRKDFEALRLAGMKAVIRFAYGESMTFPYPDAPLEVALRHIAQLKPVLQEYADVIQVLQAGFIGAWGEWYYTSNYALSPGVIMPEHWQMRRDLVNALLDALPATRQVAVRTPVYKMKLLQDEDPITEEEAFTDIPKARIGHHNDCFVSSPDDYGTYDDTAVEKPYLEADSRYILFSGETCNPYPPISDCPNSIHELSRFHWTCLNRDYNTSLLNGWVQQGCFEDVQKKLGYRFRMISSDIQTSARPGGGFRLDLRLLNEGWSGLINPRDVEVVIRNTASGEAFYYPVPEDPRHWPLGDTILLSVSAGIPHDAAEGGYDVFLRLPDPEPTISGNPAFSIRMANAGTWEKNTGLNRLNALLQLEDDPELPPFQGNGMFLPVNKNIIENPSIQIDGTGSDWQGIRPCYGSAGQPAAAISCFNNSGSFFFLVRGTGMQQQFQLFIDADRSPSTGYAAWQWQGNGSDYLIENGLVYRYTGTAHEWGWTQIGTAALAVSDTVHEIAFQRSLLNGVPLGPEISFAYANDPQQVVQDSYLPLLNEPFIPYLLFLDAPGRLRADPDRNNAVLYWTGSADNSLYHAVQRAKGSGSFETIHVAGNDIFSYTDQGLDENTEYRYRIYRIRDDSYSPAGETAVVTTAQAGTEFLNISVTSAPEAWNRIEPLGTGGADVLTGWKAINFGDSLFFSFAGPSMESYGICFNTDRNMQTGLVSAWNGNSGYDRMIRNDSLFTAGATDWIFEEKISSRSAPGFFAGGTTLEGAGIDSEQSVYACASFNGISLPDFRPESTFTPIPGPGIPGYFQVRNSQNFPDTRIIIEWSIATHCEGYILERSVGDSSHFTVLTTLPRAAVYFHDNTVSKDTAYYYRMYSYFTLNRSPYTAILGGFPGTLTFGVGEVSFNAASVNVIPNPFSRHAQVELFSPYAQDVEVLLTDQLGRMVRSVYQGKAAGYMYFPLERGELSPGIYFLRASGRKMNTVRKVVVQ